MCIRDSPTSVKFDEPQKIETVYQKLDGPKIVSTEKIDLSQFQNRPSKPSADQSKKKQRKRITYGPNPVSSTHLDVYKRQEFSPALTSYIYGDNSIIAKGYLTLNPFLFSDARSSIIFPIIILLIGGLPLPGGAVYLRHDLLKTRTHIAVTYLAGPSANIIFGIVLCLSLIHI